ncbi:S-layer homology domain-containing protein [Agathobaculum butyriciproducens]|uniref:S-layer homology domain-containing protein n=1 Tax=Agathobaculum butyriciproducens TaxID=1628085 RepID=A0AAW4W055_9FIRM|nr:S-layer homology domain-containing protein [Agathobaculum butyriciproducens]
MKRRLLSAFLAVMMVLTMAPVAFAADTSVDSYDKLVQAIASAADGDTITVSGTVSIKAPLNITKTVTLSGGTLEAAEDFTASSDQLSECALVSMRTAGKTLTLKDIKLDANQKTLVVFSDAGKVVVDGATITGGKTGSYVAGVYMTSASQFEMNSGSITGNEVGDTYKTDKYTQYAADLWIGANASGLVEDGTVDNVFVNANEYSKNNPGGFIQAGGAITNLYAEYAKNYGADVWYGGGTLENLYISTTQGNGACKKVTPVVGMEYHGGVTDDEAVAPVAKIGDTGYATLAAAVAAAADGATITMLKNDTVTKEIDFTDKAITLDLNGVTVTGNFSEPNSVIEAQGENGSLTLTDTSADKAGKLASNKYGLSAADGGKLIVNSGTIETEYAALSGNNTAGDMNFEVNGGTLTSKQSEAIYMPGQQDLVVNGGVINGGISARMGQITVNGGVINGMTADQSADAMSGYWSWSGSAWIGDAIYVWGGTYNSENVYGNTTNVNIHGGTINGNAHRAIVVYDIGNNYEQEVNVTITDGKVSGDVVLDKTYGPHTHKVTTDFRISGGLFSKDVAEYCSVGWTTVANTNEDTKNAYPYMIGVIPEINDNEVKADVATGATNSTVDTEKITTEAAQNAATTVANTVATTKPIADKSELTEDDKKNAVTALKNAGQVTVGADGTISKNVTVIKQTYLDVTATEYVIGDTDDTCRVTMNITPKYNLVAVATENNEAVDVAKGVAYLQGQDLMNAGKTEVTVTLPTQYANKKVYITHKDDVYIATADENGKITFTTNGFSPFTFALSNPNVVAEVNGNAYKSLQDAANAAKDGDEITVVKNDKLDLTFNTTKSVKVTNKTDNTITVKFNGTNKEIDKDNTKTFSYTKPSSSGGSSSGKTTYKVTTSAVNNGGVNASPSNAEKGATITITLSPDKGYKLDKLTVTDGSGKTVSTVKKSDTVYTFTMPASAVKVGVSYVKATETPSETKFNDVSANDWFASAVDYVTGKGMMNGTADNTFSPKANTTRGMVVTVLYRLENQPSTSAASFTDVASGAYYANAVAWANANGIVSGYGSGKFGPNDKVTREQLAAILYRYAQYKKYDVSVGEDTNILSYDDAQSISTYAIPAIQWACGAGVVTGKSGSKLDPKGNATRAEVAAMLMRFCENVK